MDVTHVKDCKRMSNGPHYMHKVKAIFASFCTIFAEKLYNLYNFLTLQDIFHLLNAQNGPVGPSTPSFPLILDDTDWKRQYYLYTYYGMTVLPPDSASVIKGTLS